MSVRGSVLLSLLVLVASGCGGRPADRPSAKKKPAPTAIREPRVRTASMKVASCTTAACHGDIITSEMPEGTPRTEYTFFHARDPHAGAPATLRNDASRAMIERLVSVDKDERAWLETCQTCHAPTPEITSGEGARFGCVVCHEKANDSDWIDRHHRDKKITLPTTRNLAYRAQLCVDCHVGKPSEPTRAAQQVDHDMIAAGHPALKFELASYSQMLPKHWSDARERSQLPDFELRLWLTGQRAAGRATLKLLSERVLATASSPDERLPIWPEFAQFDCFRCHQHLAGSGWRPEPTGEPPLFWGSWYFWLAEIQPPDDHPLTLICGTSLALRRALSDWTAPPSTISLLLKERSQWADVAWTAMFPKPVEKWLDVTVGLATDSGQDRPAEVTEILDVLLQMPPARDWDGATQRYLCLCAVERADADRQQGGRPEVARSLVELGKQLRFSEGRQSPSRTVDPGQSRRAFAGQLERSDLLKTLRARLRQVQQISPKK